MRPHALMRPHSFMSKTPPKKSGLHVEPIEAVHVARRIDAAKMHGVHGASLEIVQRLTLWERAISPSVSLRASQQSG